MKKIISTFILLWFIYISNMGIFHTVENMFMNQKSIHSHVEQSSCPVTDNNSDCYNWVISDKFFNWNIFVVYVDFLKIWFNNISLIFNENFLIPKTFNNKLLLNSWIIRKTEYKNLVWIIKNLN